MTNESQQEQAAWQQQSWGLPLSLDIEDTDDDHGLRSRAPKLLNGVGKCLRLHVAVW